MYEGTCHCSGSFFITGTEMPDLVLDGSYHNKTHNVDHSQWAVTRRGHEMFEKERLSLHLLLVSVGQ